MQNNLIQENNLQTKSKKQNREILRFFTSFWIYKNGRFNILYFEPIFYMYIIQKN